MAELRINLVLPFPVTKPVGGAKIMYEYANRLAAHGHDVVVYHSIVRPFKKSSTPAWLKKLIFTMRGVTRPKWFPLREDVKCTIVLSITDPYIRDADIIMSTWWQMTYAVAALSPMKGKKFNLIQDYEIWGGQQDAVDASFSLPVHHLVIARYLQELVQEKTRGINPVHLPNAIDTAKFSMLIPPAQREPERIIMLYSEEPRKGTTYGLEALTMVHEKFSRLTVTLFGVYPRPSDLPEWMHYVQRPDNLPDLYNRAAIFISPSLGEGWALPPAEAMACGCAVVCTRIGGHLDYAIDGQTALLAEKENAADLAARIIQLIEHNAERYRIAETGHQFMQNSFSWEQSLHTLESCFYHSLEK